MFWMLIWIAWFSKCMIDLRCDWFEMFVFWMETFNIFLSLARRTCNSLGRDFTSSWRSIEFTTLIVMIMISYRWLWFLGDDSIYWTVDLLNCHFFSVNLLFSLKGPTGISWKTVFALIDMMIWFFKNVSRESSWFSFDWASSCNLVALTCLKWS